MTRGETEAACQAEGIGWWTDPHNADPRFTRIRVRHTVLPMLEDELGPGVAATLARTADQLRRRHGGARRMGAACPRRGADRRRPRRDGARPAPAAVVSRVLRLAALAAGAPAAELFHVHVVALAQLVAARRPGSGHGDVQLPGHVTAYRDGDLLRFRST